MRTMGIRPGDAVLVIEHRGEQQLVYNALVAGFSMDERLAGTHGEPAIEACFVATYMDTRWAHDGSLPTVSVSGVVHISHRDFVEGRASLGYEELPGPIPGICRYCKCTELRACPDRCAWIDRERTVCSSSSCREKFTEDWGVCQLSWEMFFAVRDPRMLLGDVMAQQLADAFDVDPQFFVNYHEAWQKAQASS